MLSTGASYREWIFLLQLLIGYFVWAGWITLSFNKDTILSRKTFWFVSAVHHLIWFVWFTVSTARKGAFEYSMVFIVYAAIVGLISIYYALERDTAATSRADRRSVKRS
ncbi:hypothetical protein [Coraliomargarita akajimensis]|nr:hypothetical protein [Coraliomargarita akajimensis]